MVGRATAALINVLGDTSALLEFDALHELDVDTVRIMDETGGVGHRDDGAAEGRDLLCCEYGDVSGSGDRNAATVDVLLRSGEHVFQEVHDAEAGGFGADHGTAVGQPLACEHASFIGVRHTLVLTEEVADLSTADADVTGRHIAVLADVAGEFGHQRLAEAHDLAVAAALRVEVRSALAAADGQARDRVLEDLLEAEELHDAEVHRGVEAHSAFVRAESRVELHSERAVDLYVTGVIDPGNPEDDLTFGLAEPFERREFQVFGVLVHDRAQGIENFLYRLVKLRLSRVTLEHCVEDWLQ